MHRWLNLLLHFYPERLEGISVDRAGYVRRQVFVWLMQWRSGVIGAKDIREHFGLLSFSDFLGLVSTIWDGATWKRLSRFAQTSGKTNAEKLWFGLTPLPGISTMSEFVDWATSQKAEKSL
jgi:hypothetical protein